MYILQSLRKRLILAYWGAWLLLLTGLWEKKQQPETHLSQSVSNAVWTSLADTALTVCSAVCLSSETVRRPSTDHVLLVGKLSGTLI